MKNSTHPIVPGPAADAEGRVRENTPLYRAHRQRARLVPASHAEGGSGAQAVPLGTGCAPRGGSRIQATG